MFPSLNLLNFPIADVKMEEEYIQDPASGSNQPGMMIESSPHEEIIEDEKPLDDPDAHLLSSMSRDGMRGPYGMDMSYAEDPGTKKYKPTDLSK